ncbi:hypothetical protein B566_EDAN006622 [Ephemera danica]|nr:hypothetical protein B566_EDAN006622 [Ephemera danica]
MPYWYFDKKELRNTPSIQEGIDYETECRYRKEGARFIIDTGTKMDLGYNTMATGVVYFHRFYMFHSFRTFPRYVTACCCLFLAGKVEETPKKCKDIIKTARSLLTDQKFLQFGEDPKEEVMTLERILLQTIKFDLQVEHPYSYLLRYAKALHGDKAKLQKMVQMAWTFVNDRTHKHLRWWDVFVEDVTMDLLEDICHQVLDLYSQTQNQPVQSPPHMPGSIAPSITPAKGPVAPFVATPMLSGTPGTPPTAKRPASGNAQPVSANPVKSAKVADIKPVIKPEEVDSAPALPMVMPPAAPPAMYPRPPHPHAPYPPQVMGQQPPQAYPPPYHGYAMPHQAPTAPGQQPYFVPPY